MSEGNPVEDLLRARIEDLYTADASDTRSTLEVAWRAFDAMRTAGRLLATGHVDYAVLRRHAEPVLAQTAEILQAASWLPDGLESMALNVAERSGPLGDREAYAIHRALLDVAYGVTILLPAAAGHARVQGDRRACREATRLAYHLVNCYEGRLGLFLSPQDREVRD